MLRQHTCRAMHVRLLISAMTLMLCLLFSVTGFAQVSIHERLGINPQTAGAAPRNVNGDTTHPVYLRYGGDLSLKLKKADLLHTWEGWGLFLAGRPDPLFYRYGVENSYAAGIEPELDLGTFPQWQKLNFFMRDSLSGLGTEDTVTLYPDDFYTPDIFEKGDSLLMLGFMRLASAADSSRSYLGYPDYAWAYTLKENQSLVSMPPPEMLANFGNPFLPSEALSVPASGMVYLLVTGADPSVPDEIWTDLPQVRQLVADARSRVGDTVWLGHMSAGTSLRFCLHSPHSLVSGMNLYVRSSPYGLPPFSQNEDGQVPLQDLGFEDWTDLTFDDVTCSAYLIPDTLDAMPTQLSVRFVCSEMAPGTADSVIVKQRLSDGSLVNFPSGTYFAVKVIRGNGFARLVSRDGTDTTDEFLRTLPGFKVVAADTTSMDSVPVAIYVRKINGGGASTASPQTGSGRMTTNAAQASTGGSKSGDSAKLQPAGGSVMPVPGTKEAFEDLPFYGFGQAVIRKREILLGESQYYALMKDDQGELYFNVSSKSEAPKGNINNVSWTVAKGDEADSHLGVYYEQKNEKGADIASKGLIRLIGRYLPEDQTKTYTVRLTGTITASGKKIEAKVVVKKPAKLGDKYGEARDVNDAVINIDSICVSYGGKYGILPQFIKGHICKEAAKQKFAGIGRGFSPSYLYEPYTAQFFDWGQPKYSRGPWYVDKNTMGTGKPVPSHKNVRDIPYPTSPKTVWDMIWDYSMLCNPDNTNTNSAAQTLYGKRNDDGSMDFGPYDNINDLYAEFLYLAEDQKDQDASIASPAAELARKEMSEYIRDEWRGPNDNGPRGAKNMIAQTRLASSYGLLQLLFSTAVGMVDYPPNDATQGPEDLNMTDVTMRYGLDYIKKLLVSALSASVYYTGNWPGGLEKVFIQRVWSKWNSRKEAYANEVLVLTRNFPPKNDPTRLP